MTSSQDTTDWHSSLLATRSRVHGDDPTDFPSFGSLNTGYTEDNGDFDYMFVALYMAYAPPYLRAHLHGHVCALQTPS